MKDQLFLDELLNQFYSSESSIADFLINILITILLTYLLGLVYSKYGNSLSNRKKLIQTFVLISLAVMLVISIVKSSLALSLGLVGALSIVRFRTAIKEPEELVYFFIAIAIGLGLGANQRLVTIIGSSVIFLYIFILNLKPATKNIHQNLILTIVNSTKENKLEEKEILNLLRKYSKRVELRRLEQVDGSMELSLNIHFNGFEDIIDAKTELESISDIKFSFIESY